MEEKELNKLVRDISYLAEMFNQTLIKRIIAQTHPADVAEILSHLTARNRERVFHMLDSDTASEVIAELDEPLRDKILEDLEPEQIYEIVEDMDSDDATDLLSQLPDSTANEVLAKMAKEDSEEVKELLNYEDDTAGGIMAKEYISIEKDKSVSEAIKEVRAKSEEVKEVYYVFVVDFENNLVGVLTLKKLLLAKQSAKVEEVMNPKVISVKTSVDQEEVAHIVKKYDLISLPVVDDDDKLVGRITIDDVIDVLSEEAFEDMNHMAGISEEAEPGEQSFLKISKVRLPWLVIAMIGEIFAAMVISRFEHTLEHILALAFFTPVIMAMGGNIAIQSSTIIVRKLAISEMGFFNAHKHVFREIKVSVLNGIICSILLLIIAVLWKSLNLGLLLAISLFIVINIAGIIGTVVPLALKKIDIDPAIATGPFITISNDLIGLLIYLSIASIFIDKLMI